MRHLLLINPNTSTATTERLAQTLRPLLPEGVQLALRTASFGARYIASEASHAVAGAAVLECWAEHLAEREQQGEVANVVYHAANGLVSPAALAKWGEDKIAKGVIGTHPGAAMSTVDFAKLQVVAAAKRTMGGSKH